MDYRMLDAMKAIQEVHEILERIADRLDNLAEVPEFPFLGMFPLEFMAGDWFASRPSIRDLPLEERPLYAHWQALKRDGLTSSDFDEWLNELPMEEMLPLMTVAELMRTGWNF